MIFETEKYEFSFGASLRLRYLIRWMVIWKKITVEIDIWLQDLKVLLLPKKDLKVLLVGIVILTVPKIL